MSKKTIRFGVIGCGLMGKEFASAAARWCHLTNVDFEPKIVAVCDANSAATQWFQDNIASVEAAYTDYKELLANPSVDAIYCAVPHNLHAQIYIDIIESGKHLLGEKPFGIDQEANRRISEAIIKHPNVIVRCSSEFPFYPGAQQIFQWVQENKFGTIIEVEAGFWHSSDLDPTKVINWKRRIATNGEYGCMGDLGMHVLHLPMRYGWKPKSVRALLTKVVPERPDGKGNMVPCETWDNAILACDVEMEGQQFPMILSTKRIAPGNANTWFIRITGTDFSAEFTTKNPKQVASLPYTPGGNQAWHVVDAPYKSAYGTITGGIFEFGFSDSILQMWAAFCDELAHGKETQQPFYCATPEEAAGSHKVFTAALESNRTGQTISIDWRE
ncbi:Gfo/Idh/MocA family oxidoreductase [Paenibacillus alginolyticus]|uniref:Gfo/Idh/MocA family oxidoreductase n=1 Tax=Paenibacillus alginolyticus TaxID=59839 RepID=A0ABT4GG13_9BACL|nr:Gfo/Idh/MocA family oxidoreductase [Paenibacillus alginolyticus]MCY9670719.1 Gfo/Idh/MocA family oxidoreductase [Paenibacillus alginolyticus]MCY9695129.1 Gfo/Idh/MocA family oxidoreductase [Paenibacillus alginolyticus]MEC0147938.1 Gfo/Idh/MocA family oxidoreductase [Paenibacillus alginolyticus]